MPATSPDHDDLNEVDNFMAHSKAHAALVHVYPKHDLGPVLVVERGVRQVQNYLYAKAAAGLFTATLEERKEHAAATAHLSADEQFLAWGKYGSGKTFSPISQTDFRAEDWVPWPDAAKADTTPSAPATAPVAAHGTPSTNATNGAHAAPQGAPPHPANAARSTNGTNGAKSKYALLPKSMRPKGVIVPRF
jgi:hypothetical protein